MVYGINKSAPVSICPTGGITVQSGIDTNGNGVLDPSEVTSTQYVCNGASGTTALVSMTAEPAGTNCANGGQKVSAGLDTNGNGILDASEVTTTGYVCNGTNGTNGLNTLVAIVNEPTGANCTYGGIKVTSGLDTNANGILDPGEVATMKYVCNGPGVTWVDVTASAVQAVSNTGYSADSTSLVTITLPATPNLNDVIQVSGIGAGGWTIATNPNQWIETKYISATPMADTISGLQYESIELQYIGNNIFTVLSYVGTNPTTLVTSTGYVSQGGLIWMPVSANFYNYQQAVTLCSGTIHGLTGWRLPTQSELSALFSSVLNGQGWALSNTWSSTPYSAGGHYGVDLSLGIVLAFNDASSIYVTCVR